MDDEGDGSDDDDDDDDDDPDDARHDDGDGGDDFPSGREFPRRNLPARKVFSLSGISVMKRRRKTSTKWLPDPIRSRGVSTPKGCRRGGAWAPQRPTRRGLGGRAWGPLAAPWLPSGIPSGSPSDF